MSEQTETQTVAQASEFLKQWPSLVPAIQQLVDAKLREQGQSAIGQGTKMCERCGKLKRECFEVSQAARDAASNEVRVWRAASHGECMERNDGGIYNGGEFVQRAMDAAVAEAEKTFGQNTAQVMESEAALNQSPE